MMIERKKNLKNPISRQNFANAFAETHDLNIEVRLIAFDATSVSGGIIKENKAAAVGYNVGDITQLQWRQCNVVISTAAKLLNSPN